MKRAMTVAVLALCWAGVANANVLLSENFDAYTNGNVVGQGSWEAHSGAGTVPVQVIDAPAGLSGKAIQLVQGSGTREDVNRNLGVALGAGQKRYAGFDVIVTGAAPIATSDYFAHFQLSTNVFPSKIGVGQATGSDYAFYIYQGSGSTGANIAYGSGLSFGGVHRLVVSYDFDSSAAELWIDPDPTLGEAGNAKLTVSNPAGSAQIATDRYGFRQGSGNTAVETIDNVLVGGSWAEVVPEPATMVLFPLAGLFLARRRW